MKKSELRKQKKYEKLVDKIKFDRDTSVKKLERISVKLDKLRPKVSEKYKSHIDNLSEHLDSFVKLQERDEATDAY